MYFLVYFNRFWPTESENAIRFQFYASVSTSNSCVRKSLPIRKWVTIPFVPRDYNTVLVKKFSEKNRISKFILVAELYGSKVSNLSENHFSDDCQSKCSNNSVSMHYFEKLLQMFSILNLVFYRNTFSFFLKFERVFDLLCETRFLSLFEN